MSSRVHLISGLPRSGSTVLSALLRQNPRFSAAITSPVASLVGALMPKMSGSSEFSVFFNDDRRRTILRGVFESYYSNVPSDHTIFDSNRTWTGKLSLLNDLFPQARIICCVRELGWIINSMEQMLRKNPLQLSKVFNYKPGSSVYSRVEMLMNSEKGLIGLPWGCLREAWFSQHADKLIVINYDTLVRSPASVLQRVYQELGEKWYEHDFGNLSYDEPEYDAHLGMPGMHKVGNKVEYQNRESCIPPDIFAKYSDLNFWLKPEMNSRGIIVL
jgi:sulfotransferase